MARRIFYISDGTGITAETIGHSVLTQFESVAFETMRIPFVDSYEKALDAAERVRVGGIESGLRPVVVNTVVDSDLTRVLADSGALMLDVFAPFIAPLELELGTTRQPRVGKAHGLVDFEQYEARINATNYALTHDDGIDFNYNDADVILVGVSRSDDSLFYPCPRDVQFGVEGRHSLRFRYQSGEFSTDAGRSRVR